MNRAWIGSAALGVCLLLTGCLLPVGGSAPDDGSAAEVSQAGPEDPRPRARPGTGQARAQEQPAPGAGSGAAALEPPAAARTPDAQDDLLPQAAKAEGAAPAAEEKPAPVLPDKVYQAPEPPPVPPALAGQAAQCTKAKGRFVRRGEGGTFVCVQPTRDANKRCDDSSDCEGLCFAKSRTCAPARPLFGCYDALENGRVVNICTE